MTPLEDDVREKFAAIAAPDIPAPSTSLLRKRAHRIRTTRAVATAASIAVVAAVIGIGTTSLLNRPTHAEFAAGVTAVRVQLSGLPVDEDQWQVNSETLGGKRIVAASYLAGTNPCIGFSQTGGWCNTEENQNTVADFATVTRAGAVVAVLGRVPNDARVVDVHFGTQTHRVSAVRTPSSDKMRFVTKGSPLKRPLRTWTLAMRPMSSLGRIARQCTCSYVGAPRRWAWPLIDSRKPSPKARVPSWIMSFKR